MERMAQLDSNYVLKNVLRKIDDRHEIAHYH